MTETTISNLKTSPASVIVAAEDYPVAISSHSRITSYILGRALFEKMISLVEDCLDQTEIEASRGKKGQSFEKVARELGI